MVAWPHFIATPQKIAACVGLAVFTYNHGQNTQRPFLEQKIGAYVKRAGSAKAYETADGQWRKLAAAEFGKVGWWAFGLQGAGKPNTELRAAWLARLAAWDEMQSEKGQGDGEKKA